MNRTNIKGSITVEAIVMLGLIVTLTPILYKYVAERRQDIENINEANTLLLLKNATAEYIEENKETLNIGATVLSPADIGVDISGYRIGIRKDSDGKIDAMIASAAGGNDDMKAAKVASLLGLSAGIYSAQNTEKAWGINGIWAEDISNYGFTSLPTGIPVITTAYDKEDATGLNEEQLKEFIENTTFERVTAKEFCLDNPDIPEYARCISKWNRTPLDIIFSCNAGNTQDCAIGFQEHYNQSCQEVWLVYHDENVTPISGTFFNLTNSATGTYRTTKCYFTSSRGYDPKGLIDACDLNTNGTCKLAYDYRINQTCEQVRKAYETNGNALAPVTHRLSYKAYNNLVSTACDLTKNPSLTEYFYQNMPNTYTFSLLNRRIKYRFEVCGGGNLGGRAYGGWSWGDKIYNQAQAFFVIVGGSGGQSGAYYGAAGGTEIRFGTSGWQDKHRILVGGGSSSNIESGGGGNNCGEGGEKGGCKGIGGTATGNTPQTTINTGGNGGQRIILLSTGNWYGSGGNGGGYGGGGAGGKICAGAGGGGGFGFGGGGAGGSETSVGGAGNADNGGNVSASSCSTPGSGGYQAGISAFGRNISGFGGGGGADAYAGGGGYGGGAGGGGNITQGIDNSGGGGGRVCLTPMPAHWPLCDSSIWIFDEGGGVSGSSKCSGNGWVKISLIDTVEDI